MLASQGQGGRGPGREARQMSRGEKNVFPHSALGPQLQSSAGLWLGLQRLLQASPQASRPSAQAVRGPSPPSPGPLGVGVCVCV